MVNEKKYAKAKDCLAKGKSFEETRTTMQKLFGSGLSRTTLTELNKGKKD